MKQYRKLMASEERFEIRNELLSRHGFETSDGKPSVENLRWRCSARGKRVVILDNYRRSLEAFIMKFSLELPRLSL